jgi:hypothetical protein
MKCSFCDEPLVCKACSRPFHPHQAAHHAAVYQPDMQVTCPECHQPLVCKACGYAYGEEEKEE